MIEYLLAGMLAGLSLGALGTAWGAITVPFLLFRDLDPLTAKGTALLSEIMVSSCGAVSHKKLNNVNKELSIALLFGIAGALLGSYVSSGLSVGSFKAIIGVYEVLAGLVLILVTPRNLIDVERGSGFHWTLLIGLMAGFVKGFLGTGWGPIGVTLLVLFGALPVKVVGSSLIARVAISGSAAAYYVLECHLSTPVLPWLLAGGVVGVLLGSYATKRINEKHMRLLIGIIVLLLGVRLLLRLAGML